MSSLLVSILNSTNISKDSQRFWKHVRKTQSCWIWGSEKDEKGYGRFIIRLYKTKVRVSAHRASYELAHGSIPKGLTIDHLCSNTSCVNPEHLEVVTMKENILRGNTVQGINSRKTHCIHGHLLSGENLYLNSHTWPNGTVTIRRQCRACKKEAMLKKSRGETLTYVSSS